VYLSFEQKSGFTKGIKQKISVKVFLPPPNGHGDCATDQTILPFYDYFSEIQNRSSVSEHDSIHLLGRSVGHSFLHSLGRKLLFVFPLTNAQLDRDKEKNVVEWFGKCET